MCLIFPLRRDLEICCRKFKLGLHEAKTICSLNCFLLKLLMLLSAEIMVFFKLVRTVSLLNKLHRFWLESNLKSKNTGQFC